MRASVFLEINDYLSSIKDYSELIKLYPNKSSYYLSVSYPYGEIGDYANCLTVLKKALIIDPTNIYTYNNLSYYSSQADYYNDAINYADQGIKVVKDNKWKGVLLSNKCYGLLGLKRYNDALIIINESIKINPDNSFAYCFRAMANIGLKHLNTVCDDLNISKSLGGNKLTSELRKQYCK
jgi:tetratricopeptide (TPR) repeat protein